MEEIPKKILKILIKYFFTKKLMAIIVCTWWIILIIIDWIEGMVPLIDIGAQG